ncbi:hypothetical protein BLNAU_488 [Blattamonas nauphoetae]|uniref:SH3 domain-containing protein n=1 Tax=Blattamonas nauphoetae TaxID=2049346 RepID=A0ABQ9YLD6_9EUKA|nr:hypothetical protein BLNAU_488 [Blattamonas nauphoetae]
MISSLNLMPFVDTMKSTFLQLQTFLRSISKAEEDYSQTLLTICSLQTTEQGEISDIFATFQHSFRSSIQTKFSSDIPRLLENISSFIESYSNTCTQLHNSYTTLQSNISEKLPGIKAERNAYIASTYKWKTAKASLDSLAANPDGSPLEFLTASQDFQDAEKMMKASEEKHSNLAKSIQEGDESYQNIISSIKKSLVKLEEERYSLIITTLKTISSSMIAHANSSITSLQQSIDTAESTLSENSLADSITSLLPRSFSELEDVLHLPPPDTITEPPQIEQEVQRPTDQTLPPNFSFFSNGNNPFETQQAGQATTSFFSQFDNTSSFFSNTVEPTQKSTVQSTETKPSSQPSAPISEPSPTTRQHRHIYSVLSNYTSQSNSDISLTKGEKVLAVTKNGKVVDKQGWLKVRTVNGKVGFAPSTYLKLHSVPQAPPKRDLDSAPPAPQQHVEHQPQQATDENLKTSSALLFDAWFEQARTSSEPKQTTPNKDQYLSIFGLDQSTPSSEKSEQKVQLDFPVASPISQDGAIVAGPSPAQPAKAKTPELKIDKVTTPEKKIQPKIEAKPKTPELKIDKVITPTTNASALSQSRDSLRSPSISAVSDHEEPEFYMPGYVNFAYNATTDVEVSVTRDEKVMCLRTPGTGWVFVEKEDGQMGYIPEGFVDIIG